MITQPYPSFIDPEVGGRAKPVSNGTIFIGQNQKDQIQFPEKVYYTDSEGTEIEMSQPIHLNSAGVTVASKNSSTVVSPYTKSASYSILIRNSAGNDRYVNDSVSGYATEKWVESGVAEIIATGSTTPRTLADRAGDALNFKDFGVVGDGVNDDTLAVQSALNAGVPLQGNPSDIYILTSEVQVPPGTRVYGRGCTFKSGVFTSENMLISKSANVEFYDTTFEGGTLPTLGEKFNGSQTVKGCIWVIDPDPTIPTTGGGNKELLRHVKFVNCKFLNQPSSWIYTINLSDVTITQCHFETKADESTSSLMGIVGFGNKVTWSEMTDWVISGNKFVSNIDASGDGNVKVISFNGGLGHSIQGNNFSRVLQGDKEGVSGLNTSVFIKDSRNCVVDANTSYHPGLFVKLEENSQSVVVSNNVVNEAMSTGIITQGGINNLLIGNTFNDTASYAIYVDGHPPSGSSTSGVLVANNEINGVGVSNKEIEQSGFQRSAIIVRSVNGLKTDEVKITGNSIKGSGSDETHRKTYTGIILLSDSSEIRRLSITNNSFSGALTNSAILLNGNINDISFIGNTFTDLSTPTIFNDNATDGEVVTDLLIKGNVVQTCSNVTNFINFTEILLRGSLTITDNVVQHDMNVYSIYLSSSTQDFAVLDTCVIDNNVFNEQASTTAFFGDNVQSKIFSFCNNVIENDGDNTYILNVVGDDTNQVFEVCRIQNNVTQGRCNIRIGVNDATDGHVIIDGNTSDYTGLNTGVIFTNSASLKGYIGLNRIKGSTPTDSVNGEKPTSVKVWADLIAQ